MLLKLFSTEIYANGGICYNPSLGFMTKARACKGEGQKVSTIVTSHVPESVKK